MADTNQMSHWMLFEAFNTLSKALEAHSSGSRTFSTELHALHRSILNLQNGTIVSSICEELDCNGDHFWVWMFMATVVLLSVIGVMAPSILVVYLPHYNLLNSILFKFLQGMAAGFIICVALVHCLGDAMTTLTLCVTDSYAWGALIALLAIISVWSIEMAMAWYMTRKYAHPSVQTIKIGAESIDIVAMTPEFVKFGSVGHVIFAPPLSEPVTYRRSLDTNDLERRKLILSGNNTPLYASESGYYRRRYDTIDSESESLLGAGRFSPQPKATQDSDSESSSSDSAEGVHCKGGIQNHEAEPVHMAHDSEHGDEAHGSCPSESISAVLDSNQVAHADLIILLFALSFHTFFVGTALGLSNDSTLFFALIAHQLFEALALGLHLARIVEKKGWTLPIIVTTVFSLSGPVGASVGLGILSAICSNAPRVYNIVNSVFNAYAGGILIFVGCVHMIAEEFTQKSEVVSKWSACLAVWLGVVSGSALMAVIGIWA